METRYVIGGLAIVALVLVFLNLQQSVHITSNSNELDEEQALLGLVPIASTSTNTSKNDNAFDPSITALSIPSSSSHISNNIDIASNRSLFLIHVGKTGGETVRHTLQITCQTRRNPIHRKSCLRSFQDPDHPESLVSQHTVGIMHCDTFSPNEQALAKASTLVWTLRNPIDRIESWFHYMNPAHCQPELDLHSTACNTNRTISNVLLTQGGKTKGSKWSTKFFTCFPTMEAFAQALVGAKNQGSPDSNSTACGPLAWRTVSGLASASSGHVHFNYQFYWQETLTKYPNKEIWTLRTEHLWEDLVHLESLLPPRSNGAASLIHGDRRNVTHGSEGHTTREHLSPSALQKLCCALRPELVIYYKLLDQSQNLKPEWKEESSTKLAEQCHITSFPEYIQTAPTSCS